VTAALCKARPAGGGPRAENHGPPAWEAPSEPVPAELGELAWEQLGNLTENKEAGSIPVVIGDTTYRLGYARERDLKVTR